MLNLRRKEEEQEINRIELFRANVKEAFREAGERCALELMKARDAQDKVKKMEQTVSEMREKLQTREKDADVLRETISSMIEGGEPADQEIQRRGIVLAEMQVLKDLIEDMLKKKIPAAREAAKQATRGPKGMIIGEMNAIREKFQEEINQSARVIKDLVQALRECQNEFMGLHDGKIDFLETHINWPYIPDINQL